MYSLTLTPHNTNNNLTETTYHSQKEQTFDGDDHSFKTLLHLTLATRDNIVNLMKRYKN